MLKWCHQFGLITLLQTHEYDRNTKEHWRKWDMTTRKSIDTMVWTQQFFPLWVKNQVVSFNERVKETTNLVPIDMKTVLSNSPGKGIHEQIETNESNKFGSSGGNKSVAEKASILSVWGQLIIFFLFSFFMPDLACYQKVWVRALYCPKMSL